MADREPGSDGAGGDATSLGEGTEKRAREFMEHRPRLLGIAYRLLGSMWDAEDIVADAMVRWLHIDRDQVREPAAFLTTMVTRRALDQLRSARVARESYIGEWLPEPIATEPSPLDPLDSVERRESVSLATLRMMEQLTPPERAVFVLHEAFDVPPCRDRGRPRHHHGQLTSAPPSSQVSHRRCQPAFPARDCGARGVVRAVPRRT